MTASPAQEPYNLSGYETFLVRDAWLPKAVSHTTSDKTLSTRAVATVELGVGKNMVASIRHWAGAFGLTERCTGGVRATELGRKLLGDGGCGARPATLRCPARNLPGSWSATGNALEELAFSAKDALLTIDDVAPEGSRQDVGRLTATAARL